MKGRIKKIGTALLFGAVTCAVVAQNAMAAVTLPESVDVSSVETMAGGLVVGLIALLGIAWIFKTVRKAS
jgi:hypothetical protein